MTSGKGEGLDFQGKMVRRAEDLQDLTRLSDSLLSEIMGRVEGISGTMWVLDQNHAFRNVCSRGKGLRNTPIDPGEIIHRHEEIFSGTPFFEQGMGKVILNSLFLPILHQDLLAGLVHLELKSAVKDMLDEETILNLKTIGDAYAPYLANAQVLERIKRNPLKDLESDTYNEPFILDFLKRQIIMSRRYRRRLGLLDLEYQGASVFQRKHSYRLVQAMLRDISETLQGILRDYDVVAHVGSFRFLIVLPDTDRLGCRIAMERIRKGFEKLAYLSERFERYNLVPHFGFACFPDDGSSVDNLVTAALQRGMESIKDPFNMLQWRSGGFWDLLADITDRRQETDINQLENTSFNEFGPNFTYLLQEAVINDMVLHPERRGLLYIGTNNVYVTEALLLKNALLPRVATRVSVLGELSGAHHMKQLNINTVSIKPEQAGSFQFLLLLTDQVAYALVAVHQKRDLWRGFHTSHPRLVERLIFKLREEYSLQEQI